MPEMSFAKPRAGGGDTVDLPKGADVRIVAVLTQYGGAAPALTLVAHQILDEAATVGTWVEAPTTHGHSVEGVLKTPQTNPNTFAITATAGGITSARITVNLVA